MGRKSDLSIGERTELVLALLRREESAAMLARRAGVSEQSLYRWRDQFLDGGKAGLSSAGSAPDAHDRKVEQLEREIAKRDLPLDHLKWTPSGRTDPRLYSPKCGSYSLHADEVPPALEWLRY